MPSISLLYDQIRWEEKAVVDAARRKALPLRLIDSDQLILNLANFDSKAFGDLVLQRCVSYFRNYHSTAFLHLKGIPTVNPFEACLVCGNKLLTSLSLINAGVPTPRTTVSFSPKACLQALETLGYPAVIKPTVGSWGRLVSILKDQESALAILEHREQMFPLYQVYYVQEFVERPPRDIRSFVLGDRVIAAIYRVSNGYDWRTNTARGGRAENCPITKELEDISLKAVRAVSKDGFFGVDLMESKNGLVVHEVNNTTEFKNTVPATGVDIPALLVDYLVGIARK